VLTDTPTKPARGPGGRFLPSADTKGPPSETNTSLSVEPAPLTRDEVLLTDGSQVASDFWHGGSGCAAVGWFWEHDRADLEDAQNTLSITHIRMLPNPPATVVEADA
jgi:hypothetical protein